MKFFLLPAILLLSACATKSQKIEKVSLTERVKMEEVRSLKEMHAHVQVLLDAHPEIDAVTKKEVGTILDSTIDRQQELKDKEAQLLQMLLTLTINRASLGPQQLKEKNRLKKELAAVYDKKSENALGAIQKMSNLIKPEVVNEDLKRDLLDIVRDLR